MKNYINEIFAIRTIACLSVVLLHSINYAIAGYRDDLSTLEYLASSAFGMILYFGTPTFILISEILISNSYSDFIPKNFLFKRFKYILIPYIAMAIFYSLVDIHTNNLNLDLSTFIIEASKNIFLGDWHGYFVLIIFQFYILHALLYKKLKVWNPTWVLSISFIINFVYLAFFQLTKPMNFIFADYIWLRFNWILFLGWIFYFFLAYYIGSNYKKFIPMISKFKFLISIILVISFISIMGFTYLEIFERSSKRPDMIIYTCSLVCLLFILASILKRTPKLVGLISRYSYGIYLIHIVFLVLVFHPNENIPFIVYITLTFIGSLVSSIIIIYLLNKFTLGKYLVGKVGLKPKK
ncbi:acyltransferase family protein [Staphylococcus equorum]|uniref:acyltransferase family protein n=1 Tax=Staphylococcus equorum TaxID=246432 RepID=UPI000623FA08|nr:acyltransferase family protein [Staphylococcus equorum]ANR67299.1 hypothetical protein AWC34_01660 [Staphylococcus equorum]KKI54841.1 hypothetical protein UF72_0067 [Staphylococcus equorum subsp. equorum]MDK9847587.1 acyltransferase family protein [Staphylococcus equorum]